VYIQYTVYKLNTELTEKKKFWLLTITLILRSSALTALMTDGSAHHTTCMVIG